MRIEHIHVTAFLGVIQAEIAPNTPVTIIAGDNGAGKSTIAEAVRFALLGEPRRVSRKKDYPQLVADGHKSATLRVDYTDGDAQHLAGVKLPDGKPLDGSELPQHDGLDICLGEQRFAALAEHERRQLLMRATGVRAKKDDVAARMKRRGIDDAIIEDVTPFLRSGFDAAASTAAGHAQAKEREWADLTGEKYGHRKADDWQAEAPEAPSQNDVKKARAALTKACKAAVAQINHSIGQEDELIEAAQAALQNQHNGAEVACPECGAALIFEDGALRAHDTEPGATSGIEVENPAEALREATRRRQDLEREHANIGQIDDEALLPQAGTKQALGDELFDDLAAKADHLQQLREQATAADNAEHITAAAAEVHQTAQQYRLAEAALKPDGIPAELLREAIHPVNQRLAQSSKAAAWPSVQIDDDCAIRIGERPYALCSESEQWRADLVVAEALAYQTGLRIFMSDRVDVLDLSNRGRLMQWLGTITGDYDTVLLFGTFKKAPTGLPEGIRSYWLEGGRIETAKAQEAA